MRTRLSVFCDKLIEAGWLAAVVVVPLFFNIHSNRVFEPDKLSLLRSIALVMAAAWLVRTVEDWRLNSAGDSKSTGNSATAADALKEPGLLRTPLVLPTLLLVVVYLIATALSVSWEVSLFGSYQRLQGTYTTLSYIVIFFLMVQGLHTKRQLNRLITTAILVSFPVALYGLVQHFGMDPLPWGGDVTTRVASNMGNAIFVAAFLIMVVPLTLSRLLENWSEAIGEFEARDVLFGVLAFLLLVSALLGGMLWRVEPSMRWARWVALLVGVMLQVPIYLLTPVQRRSAVLGISLPATFAFLVAFSWILELFFPPESPNYFWLGLVAAVIFMVAMVAFAYYLRKPVSRLILLATYAVILITQLICIFYTQSRGPLLGLLAGLFLFLALLGIVKRHVWLPWLMSAAAIAVMIFLVVFNTVETPFIQKLRSTPYVGRLGRVLQTEEGTGKVRVLIWEGAAELIGWHEPLQRPGEDGGPDRFNAIRPIVGYGPESMYVAYNPFYPPDLAHFEKRNASPDRSHNETFDALVTTGWLGLAAYLFVFSSVFYFGLKWLGLIKESWQKWTFIGLWISGIAAGTIATWLWRGPAYIGVGIPIGGILGLAVYVFLSLLRTTFRPSAWQYAGGHYQLWILALLSAIMAHFVEIQFGIAIAATRTYFWVFAAAMVVIGTRLALQPIEEATPNPEAEGPTEHVQPAAGRRRKRASSPTPQPSRRSPSRQDWTGSILTLSVVTILILGTMLFDWLTPQANNSGLLATLWKSLTESKGEPSPVMLVLFLFTWAMIGLVGLSDLATHREARRTQSRDWLTAVAIFALVTLAGAFLYALVHATNLKPVTITATEPSNPLLHTITYYYLFVFLVMASMAAILAFLYHRVTVPWLWQGHLTDIGLIASIVLLVFLIPVVVSASNISIVQADILYKQGLSSERMGQWDAAIYFYEQATEHTPDQDFYYLFLGRALMEKGRTSQGQQRKTWLAQSEEALQTAREIAPLNTDHSRNLSKLYLTWGNLSQEEQRSELYEKALAYSGDARTLSPNTADVLNERAQIYLAMGELDKALETFEESLALDDEYVQTHMALGQLYTSQEEWDKAIAAYEKAAEIGRSADIYSNLGYVYSKKGDLDGALQAYQKAVELRPRQYLDHQNLAVLYNQMGESDQAILEATRALELAPESQKPALESFLAQLGQPVPASSPADAQQLQELLTQGQAQMEAEDWVAAEQTYNQIATIDPNSALAHSALAYVYAKQGLLEQAITENLAVLDLMPDDYSSYKNLAILYRQAGNLDKAIAATEQALALSPEQEREALQLYLDQLQGLKDSSSQSLETSQRAADLPPAQRNGMYSQPPPFTLDPPKAYQATIKTEKGDIVLQLYADRVPTTVNNFVFLAREGFYDNTTFHRVLPDFMAQAGDPTGTGRGGPGYAFSDEFDPELRHDGPGVLSMANAGANTNGSQFFITYEATPWLDDRHTVFGRVIQGMEVLESLTPRDPSENPDFAGDTILTISIQEQSQ
jgi:cyclophilin family peptidyl-prolyl cis-trans isomerase/tetratricopeptide (TPR) repeat protein/O-antigen ligase